MNTIENLPGERWKAYEVTEWHKKPNGLPKGDPTRYHFKTITYYISDHGRAKKSVYTLPNDNGNFKKSRYADTTREFLMPLYVKGGNKGRANAAHLRYACVPKGPYIHRLVAEAFIPNPEMKRTINHIDCDKLNNHVDNLEWATYAENMRHAMDNGLTNLFGKER